MSIRHIECQYIKGIMELTAGQIAEVLGGVVDGDSEAKVTTFARIESGKPGSISFYANPKYEKYV